MKVLVIGAGSIGNHLTQASRRMMWDVVVTDTDPLALKRMREDIYPQRYRAWDGAVTLVEASVHRPAVGEYDIIMVGTPPDSHGKLAEYALTLKPRLLHIEKPLLAAPDNITDFAAVVSAAKETICTVGYDHAVAPSVTRALRIITEGTLGSVQSIDVRIHASFDDIFAAHPWLATIHESYLSDWRRGGGALQEHSHGVHLGYLFARAAGVADLKVRLSALDFEHDADGAEYDRLAHLVLEGGNELFVHIVEDVFTRPTRKEVDVRCIGGLLSLSLAATEDVVTAYDEEGVLLKREVFPKKRPDDFFALMQHYDALLSGRIKPIESPVRIETGIEVMRYIQEAFTRM